MFRFESNKVKQYENPMFHRIGSRHGIAKLQLNKNHSLEKKTSATYAKGQPKMNATYAKAQSKLNAAKTQLKANDIGYVASTVDEIIHSRLDTSDSSGDSIFPDFITDKLNKKRKLNDNSFYDLSEDNDDGESIGESEIEEDEDFGSDLDDFIVSDGDEDGFECLSKILNGNID